MAAVDIANFTSGWLVVWVEPLGEDFWLRPDERMTVRTDYDGPNPAFELAPWTSDADRSVGIENINCCVNEGNVFCVVAEVAGVAVECGYQRPAEVDARWQTVLQNLAASQPEGRAIKTT